MQSTELAPQASLPTEAERTSAESMSDVARRIFGEDAASIQRWVDYWRRSVERNRKLLDLFRPLVSTQFEGRTILDIGCGSGGMADLVAAECRRYVGGEYHAHVLQFAPQGPDRDFLQLSGTELPFPDESFDVIFAFDVIEHLVGGAPWQLDFLREMRRVVRPTGMAFLTTPNRLYPSEGHTGLFGPQFIPHLWRDRYIAWRNPGFLKEHNTFDEIPLMSPGWLRRSLRDSGLAFLHDLPCGLDRGEYWRLNPLRGLLSYLGLGWYPHAEFWGLLVRSEMRSKLRLKLKKQWFYERNQPGQREAPDFGSSIDFDRGSFSHQLGQGWHWYERDLRGYRWMEKTGICHLQSRGRSSYLKVSGYSPRENRLHIRADGLEIGVHKTKAKADFSIAYLLPFESTRDRIFQIEMRCDETFRSQDPQDERELGMMIFRLRLTDELPIE